MNARRFTTILFHPDLVRLPPGYLDGRLTSSDKLTFHIDLCIPIQRVHMYFIAIPANHASTSSQEHR